MELAAKSGVSQTYISDLETGKQSNPTIRVLRRLEKALGCVLRFPVQRRAA
jgi:transcriptional regulator with XRE-family HTH domain